MKRFSKLLALLMAFVMIFALAACGGGKQEPPSSPQPTESTTGQKTDKKIVLGFAQVGAESEWRTANTESIQQAAKDFGIELKFVDAQQKQENQIQAIRSFISQGVDVIAFAPVVETGWDTVLREAKDAGIPVIIVDRQVKLENEDEDLYVAWMGSNFEQEGRDAAEWLISYMDKIGKGDGPVNIAELQGTVGSSAAVGRKKGFEEVIKNKPNYKIIKSQTADFTRAKGQEVMEAFLKADPNKEINVLLAHNDDMALGAIQAIEAAGRKPGEDIIIVSFDAVKGAFEAMIEGKLNCTVECNPLLGPQLMEAVVKLVNGEPIEKIIYTKEGVFPAEVAAQELPNRKY